MCYDECLILLHTDTFLGWFIFEPVCIRLTAQFNHTQIFCDYIAFIIYYALKREFYVDVLQ